MKILMLTGFFLLVSSKAWATARKDPDIAFLWAIAQVESGGDDNAVGPCGARGRYQLCAAAWRQHTQLPFRHAHKRWASDAVALAHVRWLRSELELQMDATGQGHPVGYDMIASAWRFGWGYRFRPDYHENTFIRNSYVRRVLDLMAEASQS